MTRAKARRCGHEASYVTQRWEDGVCLGVERRYCMDCRETLTLGPARDDGEHAEAVAIEMRAAELADTIADADTLVDWTFGRVAFGSDDERRGWSIAETSMQHHTDAWLAGYLARHIATHTDES